MFFVLQTSPEQLGTVSCNWTDARGVNVIRRWMRMLRNILAFVSYFLARTSAIQQGALAAVIWREIHRSLNMALRADNILMRTYASEKGFQNYSVLDRTRPAFNPEPAQDPPECAICMDRRPSVVLIPCGHTFCGPCVAGLGRCPSCRDLFESKHNFYL